LQINPDRVAIPYPLKALNTYQNDFFLWGLEGPHTGFRALLTIALFLACHLFFSVIAKAAASHSVFLDHLTGRLLENSISTALSILCFAFLFAGFHKSNIRALVSQQLRFRLGHFAVAFSLFLSLIGVNALIFWPDLATSLNLTRSIPGRDLLVLLLHTALLASLEELMFRSYLPKVLSSALRKPWAAILLSSMVFAFVHLPGRKLETTTDGLTVGYLFVIGSLLCLLARASSGIEFGMGLHTANNFGWLALNRLGFTSGQVSDLPSLGPWSIISSFVAIFILILYSQKQREGFRI